MTTVDRSTGIGASEVPAILGLSPWTTPVAVWLEKVGMGGPRRETGPMRTGTALEGAILGIAARDLDLRAVRNRVSFRHPDWPDVPLWATPDGFTRHRAGLVEVKVVGYRGADWSDGPPPYVLSQVQAQLACLPRTRYAIVAALLGSDVRTWEVERDEALITALEADVAEWWDGYVRRQISPMPEGDADRWALVRALAARAPSRDSRIATDDEAVVAAHLSVLLAQADDVAAQIADLRLEMAEAAEGTDLIGTGWRATWHDRRQVDWAAIVRDERVPKRIIERYETTSRVFTFRRTKTEEAVA